MKNLIFAHYDKNNEIDNYVIFYLNELKKFCDNIIFVSDCTLNENEIDKIRNLIFDYKCFNHQKYDFGSYQIGLEILKNNHPNLYHQTQELFFVNDSCYCLGSLEKIFEQQIPENIDAWSLTEGFDESFNIKSYYLQSFFLCFKPSIFKEKFFNDFMNNISILDNKDDIIKLYEIGLSQEFLKNNKKIYSIFNIGKILEFQIREYKFLQEELTRILSKYFSETNKIKKMVNNFLNINLKINQDNPIHFDNFLFLNYMSLPLIKRRTILKKAKIGKIYSYFWQDIVLANFKNFDINIILNHAKKIDIELANPQNFTDKKMPKFRLIYYSFCYLFYNIPFLGKFFLENEKIFKKLTHILRNFEMH